MKDDPVEPLFAGIGCDGAGMKLPLPLVVVVVDVDGMAEEAAVVVLLPC